MPVPIEKQSKKAQHAYHNIQRNFWPIPPVTQIVPNKKRYSRLREKNSTRIRQEEN